MIGGIDQDFAASIKMTEVMQPYLSQACQCFGSYL